MREPYEPYIPIGHDVPFTCGELNTGATDLLWLSDDDWDTIEENGFNLWAFEWGRIDIWEKYRNDDKDGRLFFLWAHTCQEWKSGTCLTWSSPDGDFDGMNFSYYCSWMLYDLRGAIDYIVKKHHSDYRDYFWHLSDYEEKPYSDLYVLEGELIEAGNLFAYSDTWLGWNYGSPHPAVTPTISFRPMSKEEVHKTI